MDDFRLDVESIILEMASIVRENRCLRAENERLRKVEKEYHEYVNEMCRKSEERSLNMLRCALVGTAIGQDDMELARELVDYL